MDYIKIDSWLKSALIGRIMGALLFIAAMVLQSYGFTLDTGDQQMVVDIVSGILGSVGTGFVIFSKVKESKKVAESNK